MSNKVLENKKKRELLLINFTYKLYIYTCKTLVNTSTYFMELTLSEHMILKHLRRCAV